MYALKHLSELKANPEALLQPPPEDLNSGYVVVNEDNTDDQTCCWGLACRPRVQDLPIPQNKVLTVFYSSGEEDSSMTGTEEVLFVPVINLPLSANRYYVIVAKGKRKGQVHTCSTEENMTTCCIGRCINDVNPKPFDYRDIYQQMMIIPYEGKFTARSTASDGFPPFIFSQHWALYESKSKNYQLSDALGLNNAIRTDFLKHDLAINVVAGKWYCPFIFVKENVKLKHQMERACYYEVTLEQYWQEAYNGIEKKRMLLGGKEIMREENESNDGFIWFAKTRDLNGERIGLSLALWERIKWEENRQGWDQGADAMVEEVMLGSFVLVEKFSFKRLDGSVALALEFIHTDKVRTK